MAMASKELNELADLCAEKPGLPFRQAVGESGRFYLITKNPYSHQEHVFTCSCSVPDVH